MWQSDTTCYIGNAKQNGNYLINMIPSPQTSGLLILPKPPPHPLPLPIATPPPLLTSLNPPKPLCTPPNLTNMHWGQMVNSTQKNSTGVGRIMVHSVTHLPKF